MPIGIIPIGFLSLGVFPVGAFSFGFIAAYGLVAIAPIAMGAIAGGYLCAGEFPLGRFVYHRTASDPEALRFFGAWFKPWLHAALASLCFLSYLGPRLIKGLKCVVDGNSQR